MNLKKTLATGLIVGGVVGFVASVDLMFDSSSTFQAINKEYHIKDVIRLEKDMENNPNFESEFPGHAQDYKMLISAEGYEEAREEFHSSKTKGSFGFFTTMLSMVGTVGAYKWGKRIKRRDDHDKKISLNPEPHIEHSQ